MSKGSTRRPAVVDDAELDERWARIFSQPIEPNPQPEPEPAGNPEEAQQ